MIDLIIDLHISVFFQTLGTSPCLNQRCFQLAFVTGACALHTNQIKQMKPLTHSRHTHTHTLIPGMIATSFPIKDQKPGSS